MSYAKWAGLALLVLLASDVRADPKKGPGARVALLVGCSRYPFVESSDLPGAENDVALMHDVLKNVLRYPDNAIRVLKGWSPDSPAALPTRANIERGIGALEKQLEEAGGGHAIVYFAGHGCQVATADADEADALEELFLPADYDSSKPAKAPPISDNDINGWLRRLHKAGGRVWFIADSCHSGSLARGGGRQRSIPARLCPRRGRMKRIEHRDRRVRRDLEGVTAFYAGRSHESVMENELPQGRRDAIPHGCFTFVLAQQLRRYGGRITYDELHRRVLAAFQAEGWTSVEPQAEGALGLRVGGDKAVEPPPLLMQRVQEGRLRIDGGVLRGVFKGAVLTAYAPGHPGERAHLRGRARVLESSLSHALCEPVGKPWLDAATTKDGRAPWPAEISSVALADDRIRLHWRDPADTNSAEGKVLSALATFAAGESRFERAKDETSADWTLRPRRGSFELRRGEAGNGAHTLETDITLSDVVDALDKIYRANLLRSLARPGGPAKKLDEDLTVMRRRRAREGRGWQDLRSGDPVEPGDTIETVIRNTSDWDYHVWAFLVDPRQAITLLHPQGAAGNPLVTLKSGRGEAGEVTITDEVPGTESLVVVAFRKTETESTQNLHTRYMELFEQGPVQRRKLAARGTGSGLAGALKELLGAKGVQARGQPFDLAGIRVEAVLITLKSTWGPIGPPKSFRDAKPRGVPPGVDHVVPSAWRLGLNAEVVAAPNDAACVLLAGGEAPSQILIDVREPGDLPCDSVDATRVTPETFKVDMAFRFEKDRRIAFYDTTGDKRLDLILEAPDVAQDAMADVRHTWDAKSGWRTERGVRVPWLSSYYLGPTRAPDDETRYKIEDARMDALRVLRRRP